MKNRKSKQATIEDRNMSLLYIRDKIHMLARDHRMTESEFAHFLLAIINDLKITLEAMKEC